MHCQDRSGDDVGYDRRVIARDTDHVRDATALDAEAIARVEVETWRASYEGILPARVLAAMSVTSAQGRWLRVIGLPRRGAVGITLVVERDGVVIGFASGSVRTGPTPPMARLDMLYVTPEAQRLGAGRALLVGFATRATTAGAASMWLDVLAKNTAGRRFYRALGAIELARTWTFWGTKPIVEVSYGWSLPAGIERMRSPIRSA